MTRIGIRELRQHASRYIDKVKEGEIVEVTERGELVALLVAPAPATAARERLIASGRLVPAKGEFSVPRHRRTVPGDASASEVLAEFRRDSLE